MNHSIFLVIDLRSETWHELQLWDITQIAFIASPAPDKISKPTDDRLILRATVIEAVYIHP
jgi:hypothetical protein